LISKFVFTYTILVILTARERNFDEFKTGGLHEKHAVTHKYTVWAEYIAIQSVPPGNTLRLRYKTQPVNAV
jgi:hypothetical protein